MQTTTMAAIALMLLAAPPAIFAKSHDYSAHHVAATTAISSQMAEGEVRKVDKNASRITLRHGEIKALDMPAMTMVFQVKDKAMLDQVKIGDKVRFTAEKVGGALTITAIESAK